MKNLKIKKQNERVNDSGGGGDGSSSHLGMPNEQRNHACSPGGSEPQGACCAGRAGRSATGSTSRGLASVPVTGEARMEGNLAKLKRIKVNQGDILICGTERSRTRTRRRTIHLRYGMARHPPPHAPAAARAKGAVSGCARVGANQKSFGRFYMTCPHGFRQAFAAPQ